MEQEDQGRMRDGAPIEFSPAGFSRFQPRGRFAKSGVLRVCVSVCARVKVCAYASIFIAASSRNTWQLFFVFARAPTDYCARSQSMIEHFIRELRHGSCSPLLRHVGGGGRAGGRAAGIIHPPVFYYCSSCLQARVVPQPEGGITVYLTEKEADYLNEELKANAAL